MERVLIGIDQEQASQVAVDWVIERAATVAIQVKLFTAFDMLVDNPVADNDILAATRHRIQAACPTVDVEVELADRSILEGLIERSADADLVVIGSHPHRHVRSVLTGAFPSAVVTRSHCATVVVPDDWAPGRSGIVLGAADDDSSDAATVWAAREAMARDTELTAVHAWHLPVAAMDAVTSIIVLPEDLEAVHAELLQRVTHRIGASAPSVSIRTVLRHGNAALELDGVLDSAALLVLGTRGHGPAVGTLLGSVVQHMLHHGQVPVCVVPEPAPSDASSLTREASRESRVGTAR
ncbi:MAG: universal stress protein [Pseudolysinimonas sp.]